MAGDPYFSNVSVLLHGEGSNNGTTFTDSSQYAKTFSRYGTESVTSTTEKKFGSSAIKIADVDDGSNKGLYTSVDSTLQFGTGDFTMEGWFYLNSGISSYRTLFSLASGNSSGYIDVVWFGGGTNGYLDTNGNHHNFTNFETYMPTGAWVHLALVRSSSNCKLYINGTSRLSFTETGAISPTAGSKLGVGADNFGQSYVRGYVDEFRVTKGVARYTADFSPPTEAFPDYQASGVDPVLAAPYWIRHRTDSSLITDVAPDGSGGVWALRYTTVTTEPTYYNNYMMTRSISAYVDRYDAQGTVLSTTTIGDSDHANSPFDSESMVITALSGAPIAGYFFWLYLSSRYHSTYRVMRCDSSGVPMWNVTLYDTACSFSASPPPVLSGVELNTAGAHIYAATAMAYTGGSSDTIQYTYTGVAKLSAANGTVAWQRKLTPNSPSYDALIPAGIAAVADGNVYVAATAQLTGTDVDGIVYKYNSSGTLQWQKIITTSTNCKCLGLAIDASENVYAAVACTDTSTLHVVCIATGGTLSWQRNIVFTGQLVEAIGSVAWDGTNSKLFVTVTVDSDHYISRLTSAGVVDWTRKIYRTAGGRDTAGRVKVDPTNGVFLLAGSSV